MSVNIPNRVHTFAKNYRLPIYSTIGLIIIIVLLLLLRTFERSILAGVLGESNASGQNYAQLLSGDAEAVLQQNKLPTSNGTGSQGNSTTPKTTTNTSTGLTVSSGESSTPPATGGTGGNAELPPSQQFSARIIDFSQVNQNGPFSCNGLTSESMCFEYEFYGNIATSNGPGTVNHSLGWVGPEVGQLQDSFSAGEGETFTQVQYKINLSCDHQGIYTFKMYIVSPTATTSQDVPLIHSCGTMQAGP